MNEKVELERNEFKEGHDAAVSSSSEDLSVLDWTEEEETNIRRKIDIRVVPLVTVLYLLCFLDRSVPRAGIFAGEVIAETISVLGRILGAFQSVLHKLLHGEEANLEQQCPNSRDGRGPWSGRLSIQLGLEHLLHHVPLVRGWSAGRYVHKLIPLFRSVEIPSNIILKRIGPKFYSEQLLRSAKLQTSQTDRI